MFFDKLFDSMNGSSIEPLHGKELRCAVRSSSAHHKFWQEAIQVLEYVKFISPKGEELQPPSVKNWISTVRGMQHLWRQLQVKGFKFLCTRNVNQDPVENFFGNVRSHGVRNINPTCSSFIASCKTLVVNNFTSSHSPSANCEEDDCEGSLNSLRSFIIGSNVNNHHEVAPAPHSAFDLQDETTSEAHDSPSEVVMQTQKYLAGYMAKKLLKAVGVCRLCRKELISDSAPNCVLIESRNYKPELLLKPGTNFTQLFRNCNEI